LGVILRLQQFAADGDHLFGGRADARHIVRQTRGVERPHHLSQFAGRLRQALLDLALIPHDPVHLAIDALPLIDGSIAAGQAGVAHDGAQRLWRGRGLLRVLLRADRRDVRTSDCRPEYQTQKELLHASTPLTSDPSYTIMDYTATPVPILSRPLWHGNRFL